MLRRAFVYHRLAGAGMLREVFLYPIVLEQEVATYGADVSQRF